MRLTQVNRDEYGEELRFTAVSKSTTYPEDGTDENNTYALYTPTAELTMKVNNPELFGQFNPGEEYYLDFTKAG